jgi:hypothetical protein
MTLQVFSMDVKEDPIGRLEGDIRIAVADCKRSTEEFGSWACR